MLLIPKYTLISELTHVLPTYTPSKFQKISLPFTHERQFNSWHLQYTNSPLSNEALGRGKKNHGSDLYKNGDYGSCWAIKREEQTTNRIRNHVESDKTQFRIMHGRSITDAIVVYLL